MSDKPSSVLVAEIGSLTTRVTLVDVVEGESRMIGQAEVPSSVEPPYRNAVVGVLQAAAQIAEFTGRQLLHDGQLLMPQNNERDGVDHVVSITSAAGNLALVIVAVASDVSARSALHACRSTYTSVLQVVTLDDTMANSVGNSGTPWIVRQIQSMLSLQPDLIFIAGGLENGAVDALSRLAHIVALTALRISVDPVGQQRQDVMARPVIYAGNSAARERVLEALSDRAEMIVVDNVRPALERENLEPARRELHRLYDERILSRLPGLPSLRRLSRAPVTTVCNAEGLITRFMAERYGRHILTLDVGSTSSSAFLASPGHYNLAVLGTCGTGYGLSTLINERGVSRIARWLPFSISDEDLLHWLLNKLLRPHLMPASREDLLLEHAVAREALVLALMALYDEMPAPTYDLVMAGGGVLAHAPHPGLSALTLLDALQPTAQDSTMAIDIHLDVLGLLPACGALALLDTDAAVTVFDRDLLRNMPLATCVVPLGDGRSGEVAAEAELVSREGTQRVTVRHGQIGRLPLSHGVRGTLTLRPASGVRIGRNDPGAEVRSDEAAISGSALGVIIDARGRPLRLADNAQQRQAQIGEWLIALGIEQEQSPYLGATVALERGSAGTFAMGAMANGSGQKVGDMPTATSETFSARETEAAAPESPGPDAQAVDMAGVGEQPPVAQDDKARTKPGTRISLSDLAAEDLDVSPEPQTPREMTELDRDLAKLRRSVEEPQKRGWFRRKK